MSSGIPHPVKRTSSVFVLMVLAVKIYAGSFSDLEQGFLHPPDSARPWIFWFWLNGNITSNGITADLEAMKRVGIGGVSSWTWIKAPPKARSHSSRLNGLAYSGILAPKPGASV